jgi:hypothetical protein
MARDPNRPDFPFVLFAVLLTVLVALIVSFGS